MRMRSCQSLSRCRGTAPRRLKRCRRAITAAAALSALVAMADPAGATVLQFDQVRIGGNVVPTIGGNGPEQDYGDRVSATTMTVPGGQFTYGNGGEGFTPNVVADYFAATAVVNAPKVALWQDGFGDLTNVLFGDNNSISLNVRLSADPGYVVQLHHFDLGGWPNADYRIAAVRISDGTDTLFSQADVEIEGDFVGARHTSFDFAASPSAPLLLIQIDYSNLLGGQQDNIGIDNIRFGQSPPPAVPAPASALLMAIGLLALAPRWRRRATASGLVPAA